MVIVGLEEVGLDVGGAEVGVEGGAGGGLVAPALMALEVVGGRMDVVPGIVGALVAKMKSDFLAEWDVE